MTENRTAARKRVDGLEMIVAKSDRAERDG